MQTGPVSRRRSPAAPRAGQHKAVARVVQRNRRLIGFGKGGDGKSRCEQRPRAVKLQATARRLPAKGLPSHSPTVGSVHTDLPLGTDPLEWSVLPKRTRYVVA
ncbi:hypothetical protein [Azospirillum largimobile]